MSISNNDIQESVRCVWTDGQPAIDWIIVQFSVFYYSEYPKTNAIEGSNICCSFYSRMTVGETWS